MLLAASTTETRAKQVSGLLDPAMAWTRKSDDILRYHDNSVFLQKSQSCDGKPFQVNDNN